MLVENPFEVIGVHCFDFDQLSSHLLQSLPATSHNFERLLITRIDDPFHFQVDLAKTVSKYIGETEERLDVVFTAAERAGAVLLFDEADALFGKRTEVRDAHDRYANIEVSYLLQRMESFSGLAILTTNMRQNLDRGFLRRLRFDCEFPAPGVREREAIWHRVFPADAPLASDIGFEFLARRLKLTGGHIQQIAIRAAFLAASAGEPIQMRHIVHAAGEELRKLGMANVEKSLATLAA